MKLSVAGELITPVFGTGSKRSNCFPLFDVAPMSYPNKTFLHSSIDSLDTLRWVWWNNGLRRRNFNHVNRVARNSEL